MQFMLMFYENQAELAKREGPEAQAYWAGWTSYVNALGASGIVRAGEGLQPPKLGTSLRVIDGKRIVQDGPFADTHEQLGGFFIIEVPSVDEALEWAARAPCAGAGGVEVRPTLPPMPAERRA